MSNGWIAIDRGIEDHWIYKDSDKLKAWLCILINVNHSERKVLIGDELFICDRGESLMSLESWATKFGKGWNKSKVRRFLKLLENDSMIVIKSNRKTTHLKVCQYDTYQSSRNTNETQMKHKRNANETQMKLNNNENNDKQRTLALPTDGEDNRLLLIHQIFHPNAKSVPKDINTKTNKSRANKVTDIELKALVIFYSLPKSSTYDATWSRKGTSKTLMNQLDSQIELATNFKPKTTKKFQNDIFIINEANVTSSHSGDAELNKTDIPYEMKDAI